MKPLVSVIVPVYKVEERLKRCLESLSRQSLSDIEILLIDDASPDKCSEICDEYVARDVRFKVIHNKKNMGLSCVRNIGIKNASSNYLMFVDSDDWVHTDFCKEAYECAIRNQADLVFFRYKHINKNGHVTCCAGSLTQSGFKTRLEGMDLLQRVVTQVAWNKLYRKELFNTISYPPGYLQEDLGTTYKIIWKASRIYYLDKVLYYHCYRAGSIGTLKTEKALSDWYEMYMQQYFDLTEWGYPKTKLDSLLKNIAISYCIKKKPDFSDERYIYCASIVYDSKCIPDDFTWRKQVMFALFKYCKPLFEVICVLYDRKVC